MSQTVLKICILAFVIISQTEAKFYNDNLSINSRVPGDQEILRSNAVQNLNFYAKVSIEARYPEELPHSGYTLSHVYLTGQDDTGYIDARFDQGGPGEDYMRMKIFFNSIQNGKFQLFLYGKKK
ncbi:uncharacterized protein LOC129947837 [Eupeodes corollae]|uniref:uncharacterized protein LOC129947837 n=1 Tax=Eupeodes corollae TaxID=290404 RepID=UPI0024924FAA|nr:uncharacterized protein LOC129947837 [Eupeodes corollae]